MTQAIVPFKVSDLDTAVHEAMHAATLIYKTIDNTSDYKRLNAIFDWILYEATIVQSENSAGCFRHRSWIGFTEDSNISCSLSGFIGSYNIFGYTNKEQKVDIKTYIRQANHLMKFVISKEFNNKHAVRRVYKLWSSDGDFDAAYNYCERDFNKLMKCMEEIVDLIDHSDVYLEMVQEIAQGLLEKYTLDRAWLTALARKYQERIILESQMRNNIVCVSLGDPYPSYSYFRVRES